MNEAVTSLIVDHLRSLQKYVFRLPTSAIQHCGKRHARICQIAVSRIMQSRSPDGQRVRLHDDHSMRRQQPDPAARISDSNAMKSQPGCRFADHRAMGAVSRRTAANPIAKSSTIRPTSPNPDSLEWSSPGRWPHNRTDNNTRLPHRSLRNTT